MKKIKSVHPILKILLGLFLLLVIYLFFTLIIQTMLDPILTDDEEYRFRHYQELIAADNYGDLHAELLLFDCYDETYDDFWKVTEAYQLYCQYEAAILAAQKTEDMDFAKTCEEQADKASKELQAFPEDAANPTVQAAIIRIKEKIDTQP